MRLEKITYSGLSYGGVLGDGEKNKTRWFIYTTFFRCMSVHWIHTMSRNVTTKWPKK